MTLAKVFIMLVMCLGAVGGASSCPAHEGSHDLHEQSQQPPIDEANNGREWLEEKTGQYLPLDPIFADEKGVAVRLGDIIDRPTLLLPIYFACPDICSRSLANLAVALNNLHLQPGRDFRVIALSFNEKENYHDAAQAKKNYLKIVGEGFPVGEWFFLTGGKDAIKAVTDAVGFRFKRVDGNTFVHPAALMAIAADGKIIRYVYGSFLAGDIDIALSSAKSGAVVGSVRRLLAFCFNYDPKTSRSAFETIKIAVLVIFGVSLAGLWLYVRGRGRRSMKADKGRMAVTHDTDTADRGDSTTQDKQS